MQEEQRRVEPETGSRVIGSFPSYRGAQALVDRLSDSGFPVEHLAIVGDGLRTVERVTGRLTWAKAIGIGAVNGLMIGAFVCLLIALLSPRAAAGETATFLVLGGGYGALIGAVIQLVYYWSTRGSRDFMSVRGTVAQRYRVTCDAQYVQRALDALAA